MPARDADLVQMVFDDSQLFDTYCRDCKFQTSFTEMHGFKYGGGETFYECDVVNGIAGTKPEDCPALDVMKERMAKCHSKQN